MGSNVVVESVPGCEGLVRIPLGQVADSHTVVDILRDTFEDCFRRGHTKIILDLAHLTFPSSSLIALLIEATSRARRLNGDVKILNLQNTAKNNLATFSPLTYLSVEGSEVQAMQDFGFGSRDANDVGLDTEEIAEAPIVEKLENRLEAVPEEAPSNHLRVKSQSKHLYTICDFVTDFADKLGFDSKDIGKIKIAVYEASLNVIEHAYRSNPDNWIDVWVESRDGKLVVTIQDYGRSFEGAQPRDYNVMSAMDHRQTGGFGLYIIRRSMDEINYESDERGNRLTLVKHLKS